jgi:hypothetical protein
MNYVPLAISAHSLSRPGALEAELAARICHASCVKPACVSSGLSSRWLWWWPQWRKVGAAMVRLVGRRNVEQARWDEALGHRPRSVRPG